MTSGDVLEGGVGVTSSAGSLSVGAGSSAGAGATKFNGGAGGVAGAPATGEACAQAGRAEMISNVERHPPSLKRTPPRSGPTCRPPLVYPGSCPACLINERLMLTDHLGETHFPIGTVSSTLKRRSP